MQLKRHLFDRAERNHEKEQRAWKKQNARNLFTPQEPNDAKSEEWRSEKGDARLQRARADDVEENSTENNNQPEVTSLFRRGGKSISMVPKQTEHNQRNDLAVFLVVLRQEAHPRPGPDRLRMIGEQSQKAEEVNNDRNDGGE